VFCRPAASDGEHEHDEREPANEPSIGNARNGGVTVSAACSARRSRTALS
jgi:hypothetical protein